MKSGFIVFLLVMLALSVSALIMTSGAASFMDDNMKLVETLDPRLDLQGREQIVIDPITERYLKDVYLTRPEAVDRVTPEEYQNAWMNYWAKQEGHEPFAE